MNEKTQQFITKAKQLHGEKYDYSKTIYTKTYEKVLIICPLHGPFKIFAKDHLSKRYKRGCPSCSEISYFNKRSKKLEDFIQQANQVHNNKYDYSKVQLKGVKSKVEIICPLHGSFWVSPNLHISQQNGCPICKSSKGEQKIISILKQNDIKFIRQKTFPTCINDITKKRLRFDFFLPEYNILIEYDGEGHFKPIQIAGISKQHAIRLHEEIYKRHDAIKTIWAQQNNILLIRIPYFYTYEDIIHEFEKNNIKIIKRLVTLKK